MANRQILPCPICRLNSDLITDLEFSLCDCPRCGDYQIAQSAIQDLSLQNLSPFDSKRALISYYCRRMKHSGQQGYVDLDFITKVVATGNLPKPAERLDNLVMELARLQPDGGVYTEVHPETFQAVIGAATPDGVAFIAAEAVRAGLAVSNRLDVPYGYAWTSGAPGLPKTSPSGSFRLRLTMDGWRRYDELARSGGVGSIAFMAMKFGDAELDHLVNTHLRPAITATGFTLRRLDDQPKAGLIDDRLRVEIRACRFLLADLTHANLGAYWEAGFAEGLGKPVIYLCRRSAFSDPATRPHFDTNHHLTITWELDTAAEDMAQLKATIRYSIPEARQGDVSQYPG